MDIKTMARHVFFSFHFERDVRRVVQVRNSWLIRPGAAATPFYDHAEFEKVKTRAGGIEKWIAEQMTGCSVTVVLFGAETYGREWVKHEIKRSYELGKGILAIDIHRIKDPQKGVDVAGKNPLSHWQVEKSGVPTPFTKMYKTYDWVLNDGYTNMSAWIDAAALAAGR
jgi:hypothetical protein